MRKKFRVFIVLISSSIFTCIQLNAQQDSPFIDTILAKLELYSINKPASLLFVHYDKTIYTNNENIWFTAYLLNDTNTISYHTVAVALIRSDDKRIVLEEKYKMSNGHGFGNLTLPDTIPPGNYQLLAYTNVMDKQGHPADVFDQPIVIKTTTSQSFNASLVLLDSIKEQSGPARVLVKVSNTHSSTESKKETAYAISYNLGNAAAQKAKTDIHGEYQITLPEADLAGVNGVLFVEVKHDNEIKYLSLHLPGRQKETIHIGFYPEGGNLVEGLLNQVGWEAKTNNGQAVKLKAELYKDNKVIDTISTDIHGMGRFNINPVKGSSYSVKPMTIPGLNDTSYLLPKPQPDRPLISIANAITGDTLKLQIIAAKRTGVRVLVHNYREAFANVPLQASAAGISLKLSLQEIPRGLAIITILDSLDRPLAERLFFAHYDQPEILSVTTDKLAYTTRDKVKITLRLTDEKTGKPLTGAVSIACVQNNRIENANQQDIESYSYLLYELGKLPVDAGQRIFNNKEYLENILLVKGWRRYTWQELMNTTAGDTLQKYSSPRFTGSVTRFGKQLKKPVMISALSDSLLNLVATDDIGRFEMSIEDLQVAAGRKLALSVNQKDKTGIDIRFSDPYHLVNNWLASHAIFSTASSLVSGRSSTEQALQGFEKNVTLKEVIVSSKKDASLYSANPLLVQGVNRCGDYVCVTGAINCPLPGHNWRMYVPVKGHRYMRHYIVNGIIVRNTPFIYSGCELEEKKPTVMLIDGINMQKEFYPVDYTVSTIPEPMYLSTIYWNHLVQLDKSGSSEISFYTSDITGSFRLVVQGTGNNNLFFKQLIFPVK